MFRNIYISLHRKKGLNIVIIMNYQPIKKLKEMRHLKMKSLLLSVMALIAVGSVSTTLVSCDDDDEDTTIYQQWKMSEADFEELVDDHSQLIGYDAAVYDFTQRTKIIVMIHKTEDGKWYTVEDGGEPYITIEETGKNTGIIISTDPEDGSKYSIDYMINGKNLMLIDDGILIARFSSTSGVKSSGTVVIDFSE